MLYENSSQVYAAGALETIVKSPPPKGSLQEDRKIFFITYMPDEKKLCVSRLTDEDIKLEEIAIEVAAEKKASTKETVTDD